MLVGLLKDKLDPDAAVNAFEHDVMADVAALPAAADDAEGLEIGARARDEMAAIVELLRDALPSWSGWSASLRSRTSF